MFGELLWPENLTTASCGSGGASVKNTSAMGAPCLPSSAERRRTRRGTRGTTWLGSSTSMATRARRRAPVVSSVGDELGEGGEGCGSGGREMVRGFSWRSKLREGGRGEARRRPRRLLGHAGHATLCLAAWGRRQREEMGWAGWASPWAGGKVFSFFLSV